MKQFIKTNFLKLLTLFLVLITLSLGLRVITKAKSSQRVVIEQKNTVKASVSVGKSFEFEAAKVGKKGVEEVTFTIVSAELKEEIKVKGTPKKAESGKLFLVLRFEIENGSSERLSLISSDLVRLVTEGEKKFAPDFHNASIIIDPLSVRKDLVSFIVLKEEKSFTFSVGELEKKKEELRINF